MLVSADRFVGEQHAVRIPHNTSAHHLLLTTLPSSHLAPLHRPSTHARFEHRFAPLSEVGQDVRSCLLSHAPQRLLAASQGQRQSVR